MAMNKKEKAYVEDLECQLLLLRSMTIVSRKVKPDLPPPNYDQGFNALVKGWSFNKYNHVVEKTCSSMVHHGKGWEKTSSQNPIHQYSSKVLALKSLRYEVEQDFYKDMAKIDKRIADAEKEND